MAAIRTETGKYSLDGNIFKILDMSGGGSAAPRECADAEIPGILEKYFGIRLG
jgi:hypothetical protein